MRASTIGLLFTLGLVTTSCIISTGPEGPPGQDGVVEIYTSTITINADVDFGVFDQFVSIASYSWEILDVSTVDYGIVLAYLRFDESTAWNSLPLSTPFENDVVVLRYGFDVNNFDLIVEGEVAGNNELNEGLFDRNELRVVAIPPSLILK
ncbi:MAG: hypothetical protein MI700_04070, partial [Balneolales bacterium]|nr:hypothetical protein [Balneolales bacterium]